MKINVIIYRQKIVTNCYRIIEFVLKSTPFLKVKPNTVSSIALVCGLISALFFGFGHTFFGGLFLLLNGILDTFDGSIARMKHMVSKFGAQLDSVLDRYAEFAVFLGILFHYRTDWMFFIVFLAMVGSVMVSYARARAESLGSHKVVGLMQRPERVILLATGAIINAPVSIIYDGTDIVLRLTIIVLAISSNITAVHRILKVKKEEEHGELG